MIDFIGYSLIALFVFVTTAALLRRLYECHPYFRDYSRRDLKEIEEILRRAKPK